MAPLVKDPKQFVSKLETKNSLHDELLERLKLEEAREKRKLEKEAKRRAELEKMKQESLQMQATLTTISKNKNKKHSIQPKKSNPPPKQRESNFATQKSKSASVSKDNDSGTCCESVSSNSAENGWTPHHNSYNSKAKPPNYRKQTSFTSKNKYSQGTPYEHSNSWCDSSSFENQYRRSRYTPVSDSAWDSEENFPALGEAPVPKVNVWAQRISKAEEIKALQPQTIYDEEAMLRKALELSMKEAHEEEERRRKLDEELLLQAEALEVNPEFNEVLDDFEHTNYSECGSSASLHSTTDQWTVESKSSYNSSSNVSKNENCTNSEGSNDRYTVENNSNSNSMSYVGKKVKNVDSRGARPKINKIIDSFGGWGLNKSDKKIEKKSEKLSDFVDEVIQEKHKSVGCNNVLHKKNSFENDKRHEDLYSNDPLDTWSSAEPENVKESVPLSNALENKEILYDGKGTFTDFVDDGADVGSVKGNKHDAFCDNNVVEYEETQEEVTKAECQEIYRSSENLRFDTIIKNTDSVYTKSSEDRNDISSYDSIKKKESFESDTFNATEDSFIHSKSYASKDFFHSEHEILNLPSKEYFPDQPVSSVNSFCGKLNLENELESKSFTIADAGNSDFVPGISVSDSESLHILPPYPAPSMCVTNNNENTFFDCRISDTSNQTESSNFAPQPAPSIPVISNNKNAFFVNRIPDSSNPNESPILSPQPAPSIPVANDSENVYFANKLFDSNNQTESPIFIPQPAPAFQPSFPLMNPLLPNLCMFPGGMNFNPLMGCVMDPVMMRQMLMLSNPFFASQLLSMEQYFKAQGIATDVFSMHSQAVPNPPVVPLQPKIFNNVMNPDGEHSQFQTQVPSSNPVPPSKIPVDSVGDELHIKHKVPPGLDTDITCSSMPSEVQLDDDSWFKSYFSNDNSVSIPPPRLPDAEADPIPAPKPLASSQSTSGFNQNSFENINISAYHASSANTTEGDLKPLAVETCMTKVPKSGWSDSDDESAGTCSRKWSGAGDDDGWGDDTETAKPVKQSLKHEDRRRPYRQPASRPQFSHSNWSRMNK